MKISEDFNINLNKKTCHIIMSRLSKEFITLNFDNAQKLGYLEKLSNGFFGKRFVEKFLVLTDIGLLYFDDPNEKQPKRIIPILGSDFKIVDCKDYKKNFCFEIKTLTQESFIFSGKTEEEARIWLKEFHNFKTKCKTKLNNVYTKNYGKKKYN